MPNRKKIERSKNYSYYSDLLWCTVPLIGMSWYYYGPRPLLLCGVALLVGNLCDRLISLLRRRVYQPKDYSNESFALIIALLAALVGSYYHLEKNAQEPASSASDSIQSNDNKVIDYQLWDK